MAARLGGTRRERGLDVRREGEGEGVARFEEFREAVLAAVGGDAVRGGECGGGLGPAAPRPPVKATPGCAASAGAWVRSAQEPEPTRPMRWVLMGAVCPRATRPDQGPR